MANFFNKHDIMKKNLISNIKVFLLVATLFPLIVNGQIEVKWNKQITTNIQWQEVSSLGNLIICSREALMGINTETGDITWSKPDHANLERELYRELPNSPFFTIENNNVFYLIDQFSGDEVFNSAKAGMAEIKDYFLLYNSDAILVAGNNAEGNPGMLSVKMSDGSLSWSMNEKFGRIIATTELGNDELLIVTLFNNYKINASNGNIIWKEVNSKQAAQVDKLGAFGDLIKTVAENLTSQMDIQLNYYRKPGGDVFYLGSQQEHQSSTTSSSGEPMINYTNNYMAYKISDGSQVWEEDLEVKGMLGHVVLMESGLLILPDDGNRTKINLFDYQTRSGLWGKKGRGIAIKGGIYDYLDSGEGILLVSRTSSNNFLNFLDPKAGVITFEKPVKVDGSVVGIVPLLNSILYITTESMNILDQSTGSLKWKKSIQTNPELTAEYDGKIYAFDSKSGIVKIIDMETEQVKDLSTTAIEFQGKEVPRRLEVMDDGIFLHSDQNLAKIDFNGTIKFIEYYPAPREAGWKRALLYAAAVRSAYVSAESYYVAGSMAYVEEDVRKEDEFTGDLVSQIGDAYGELGDAAASYAGAALKRANARMKATKSGRDFIFIMSKQDNDIVLLKVSKITGKIEGEIALGKDREPNYAVDDITGQVYYLIGENELTSYQVK
jgi:outer membrane protein assembly factor BamB